MVSRAAVLDFVDRLAQAFSPRRVVLFGSHARATAGPDSDVDLLVVMPTDKRPVEQALEIRRRIPHSFPLDLLVRTPQDVRDRLAQNDIFLTAIICEGETLYESPG